MKKIAWKMIALLLVLCVVLPLAACGGTENNETKPSQTINARDLVDTLLQCVQFDTKLMDAGDTASLFFPDMPENALVTMYSGSGYFADELTWITLYQESDMEQALTSVDTHIAQVREQFLSYIPEEVDKIDNAVIWTQGVHIVLCITNDYDNAAAIVKDPGKAVPLTTGNTEDTTEPDTTEPETTQPDTTEPDTEPPSIVSGSTSIEYRESYMVVDNVAYEYYNYSDSAATNYAKLVSKAANALQGQTDVYCIVIPTAVGVTFPDNVKEKYSGYQDQEECLRKIYGKMDSSVIQVNIFNKLMAHRDEYLYYHTDWHWTGVGAYYGYERFCEVKGITPYTMAQREEHIIEGYKGPFSAVTTPDTIYAYEPYYKNQVKFVFTETSGNSLEWPVINTGGVSQYWSVFAAGDQPYAVFTNSAVTDGSVAIVVKESFGNAMMSYFCDHYSTVYEIDYRYWNGDLVSFAKEMGADDIIFANNIGMVRSDLLIGKLARIIP